MEYRSTGKTVFSAKYHLIWVPKYRRRVLITGVAERLKGIIGGVVEELGGTMIELEVMPDHVHLLAEIPPRRRSIERYACPKGQKFPAS